VQTVAGEETDQDANPKGQREQHHQHGMDLAMPAFNPLRAALLGLVDDVVEILADLVHQLFAMKVEFN
jgi:hypothetical protein